MTNILIDLEPLYFILTGQWPLHRIFHTYLGATVIAVVCVLIGRPVCYSLTGLWNKIFTGLKIANGKISQNTLVISAFIGTYSHILLDSIMHRDMRPYYPLAESNHLLNALTYGEIHLFCLLTGIVGGIIYYKTKRGETA